MTTKDILKDLLKQGFSYEQIKDAMEDGAFLAKAGISQAEAEEIHFLVTNKD